jgi:shikimate kinase
MGVGKTTVGRKLAKVLDRPFVDVDEAIELRAGRTIATIFRTDGEPEFRRVERDVIAELHERDAPLVIAAGGGAVTVAENRAVLREHAFVVWLQASPRFLAARVDPTHRPLLAGAPGEVLERLEHLASERAPAYEAAADLTVDVEVFHLGERPKHGLANHIAELLRDAEGARA